MPASEKVPGIFISYRRSDTPDAVGRIYDRLVTEFGKARVFKDVDSIPLGQDFRGHLNGIIGGCVAVLAIIGPKWIDTRNSAGQRRLEDPDDFVRIELEAALARSVPVVPVLVGHAPMPGTSQLPSTLSSLAFRQSIEVRPDPDFHNDATRLVTALKAIIDPNAPVVAPVPEAVARPGRPLGWIGAFTLAALAAAALAIPALKHLREVPLPETRFEIPIPETSNPLSPMALSPDGRLIAYVAGMGDDTRLWLRPMASTSAQLLPGTEGASGPFWSPDSRSIGFTTNKGALKRLDLGGGAPQTLVATNVGFGGSWNADGVILFSSGPGLAIGEQMSIFRVSTMGGAVTEVHVLDQKTPAYIVPTFLPDGRRFLFAAAGDASGIYMGSLDGDTAVRLTSQVGPFSYLPTGWLLVFKYEQRVLVAQRLDANKAALVGEPVTLAQGRGSVSAASPGLVAFRSTSLEIGERQLAWRNRSGGELGIVGEPDSTYNSPRVSPDGKRVVVMQGEQGKQDVWLLDGVRSTRVTFEGANTTPAWSPDSSRIAYRVVASEGREIYLKPVNGLGEAERLLKNDLGAWPASWSPDGRFLLFMGQGSVTDADIGVVPLAGARKPSLFVGAPSRWGQFSPDGKWVAYQSNASGGRDEIFVRPFVAPGSEGKGAASGRWQVSESGGIHPTWSPDGKELYFINPLGEMMAVPIVVKGSALEPGRPMKLFQTRILNGGVDTEPGRQYDVAPDGRFLINQVPDSRSAPITLIQNWNPDAGK
jgi:eukaryotic-like serine/threonine-protein kinase